MHDVLQKAHVAGITLAGSHTGACVACHPGTDVAGNQVQKRRTVLVMFIGGVTFAEIGALRFLSTRPETRSDFVIATTKLESGNTILESFLDDVALEGMSLKATRV